MNYCTCGLLLLIFTLYRNLSSNSMFSLPDSSFALICNIFIEVLMTLCVYILCLFYVCCQFFFKSSRGKCVVQLAPKFNFNLQIELESFLCLSTFDILLLWWYLELFYFGSNSYMFFLIQSAIQGHPPGIKYSPFRR